MKIMCFLLFDCPLEIEVQKEKKERQFELKDVVMSNDLDKADFKPFHLL